MNGLQLFAQSHIASGLQADIGQCRPQWRIERDTLADTDAGEADRVNRELFAAATGISPVSASDSTAVTADEALLARIRAGDAVALATVYRRHAAAVYRFACLHAASREAAADATQETFLWLATQAATGFDPARSTLAAFLCGVARNHARRMRAAGARFEALPAVMGDDETGAATVGDPVADALAHLLARERGEALLTALATLAPEHREVIALIEFEEFSYADAASIIGCPLGTVRSRLNRAKVALRQRITELFPNEQRISA